ncbi:thioredoxin domain-containing protein [Paenibacillus kobensis]|uniref:thioredoxin domain-containing protein n=1 Tax=Paenibacillus kobensis TaxID=59841 RepID=UPI000FD74D3A|nr:thioredoxin domain-containing protein [Paenibacillus kobensis]
MTTNNKPNRLAVEKSPYLLQHAYNPVDWYAWGPDAFAKAKADNKPIFLSIGYSTCHWCHVMERESFEDREVAELLNREYVAIKVDREERPDIDQLYMAACQAMTGSGGWPLTILMTPDQEPFFAGTYLPKRQTMGRFGLMELLTQLSRKWSSGRGEITGIAAQIRAQLEQARNQPASGQWNAGLPKQAFETFASIFDEDDGGFGGAPKFPTPHNLSLLMAYGARADEPEALRMAEETLDAMWRGGLYDHIGFGFARYSTDTRWLVPHFEKMLYDNALLAVAYTEAYQRTGSFIYSQVTDQIFTYVSRDMTSPEGGFFSAEDADSEGVEGKFYVWTPDEVKEVLGEQAAQRFNYVYDITEEGNFEGRSIPNRIESALSEASERFGVSVEELEAELEESREKLFEARARRVHPHKDDKILTAWNGLMIAAFALAAKAFGVPEYADRAASAAQFIQKKLTGENGRLLARYREGEAAIGGFLDDYAFLIWGLNELYEATLDPEWLEWAQSLADDMIRLYGDEEQGGFFFTAADSERLLIRMKETFDGALPSGNSVAARQLLKLFQLTGEHRYREWAHRTLDGLSSQAASYPSAHTMMLMAGLSAQSSGPDVVITGDRSDLMTALMISEAQQAYLPHGSIIFVPDGEEGEAMRKRWPHLADKRPVDGKPSAYVCRDFTCHAPVMDAAALEAELK